MTDAHQEDHDCYETVFPDLCSLLDALERAILDEDLDRARVLVMGRFNIVRKHGFEVRRIPTDGGAMQ